MLGWLRALWRAAVGGSEPAIGKTAEAASDNAAVTAQALSVLRDRATSPISPALPALPPMQCPADLLTLESQAVRAEMQPLAVAEEGAVRGFRLPQRLAATRLLNKPSSRTGTIAGAVGNTSRKAQRSAAKRPAPRRHVWLAPRPVATHVSGQVIPLPLAAERTRELARAA